MGCWRQQHSPFPEKVDGILACFNDKHEAEVSVAYFRKPQIELADDLWQWTLRNDRIYITAEDRKGGKVVFSCHFDIRSSPDVLRLDECLNMETTRDVTGDWRRESMR